MFFIYWLTSGSGQLQPSAAAPPAVTSKRGSADSSLAAWATCQGSSWRASFCEDGDPGHMQSKGFFVFSGGGEPASKPYEFIGFGAVDVTKPYKFIGFGASRTGNRRFWAASGPTRPRGGSGEGSNRGPARCAAIFSPVDQF